MYTIALVTGFAELYAEATAVVHDQSSPEPTSNRHIDRRLIDRLPGVLGT